MTVDPPQLRAARRAVNPHRLQVEPSTHLVALVVTSTSASPSAIISTSAFSESATQRADFSFGENPAVAGACQPPMTHPFPAGVRLKSKANSSLVLCAESDEEIEYVCAGNDAEVSGCMGYEV
jgi:hypothetical protein